MPVCWLKFWWESFENLSKILCYMIAIQLIVIIILIFLQIKIMVVINQSIRFQLTLAGLLLTELKVTWDCLWPRTLLLHEGSASWSQSSSSAVVSCWPPFLICWMVCTILRKSYNLLSMINALDPPWSHTPWRLQIFPMHISQLFYHENDLTYLLDGAVGSFDAIYSCYFSNVVCVYFINIQYVCVFP